MIFRSQFFLIWRHRSNNNTHNLKLIKLTEIISVSFIKNVIKTNNTAQQEFDNILLELRTTIIELNIQSELHGDLDLSILTENNYQQIGEYKLADEPALKLLLDKAHFNSETFFYQI